MRWILSIAALALLCVAALEAPASAQTFPERGRATVVDAAGIIPDEAEAALAVRLIAWNRETGHQLVVATIPTLEGYEIQDYGYRLLRHWRLGRVDADDGVILILAPNERQVRIEVGYGLEPVLTDALSSQIIRETVRPALRVNDIAGALTAGADRIMAAATPGAADIRYAAPERAGKSFSWWWIMFGALGLIGLAVFLYPLFGAWYAIWPLYILFPAAAKRAEQRNDARLAEAERKRREDRRYASVTRAEDRATAEGKSRKRTRRSASADAAYGNESDALEALQERARHSYDSNSSYDSYDTGSSSADSGFDGGGGSAGGGGADSDY